ncbi:multidrug transporter [Clostridia bacterium]|nr:multidrug transporter [Clostridia bacterium]
MKKKREQMKIKNIKRQKRVSKDTFFIYGLYSFIFAGALFIVWGELWKNGYGLIEKDDAIRQHLPMLSYFSQYLQNVIKEIVSGNFQFPLFDFHVGLGEDVLRFSAHSSPLDIFSIWGVVVPQAYIIYFYYFLVILRMYAAGIAFLHFCRFKKIANRYALFGAINYVFSGWVIFTSTRHPFFMIALFYLPLLMKGLEKVFQGGTPFYLISMIFLSGLTGFYFLYMELMFMGIYSLVRIHDLIKKENLSFKYYVKQFSLWIWLLLKNVLLGLSLASVYLIPIILGFLDSSRPKAVKVATKPYTIWEYFVTFIGFIAGKATSWNIVLVSSLSFLTFLYFFFSRKRKKDKYAEDSYLKVLSLILVVLFVVPFGSLLFNGFAYVSHRWTFTMLFVLNYCFVYTLPDILERRGKDLNYLGGVVLFLLVVLGGCVWQKQINWVFAFFDAIFLSLSWLVLRFLPKTVFLFKSFHSAYPIRVSLPLLVAFLCMFSNVFGHFFLYHLSEEGNDHALFYQRQEINEGYTKNLFSVDQDKEEDFFRVDVVRDKDWINYGLVHQNYFGLSEYWSMINGNVSKWLQELKSNGLTTNNQIFHLDQSTILNAITSVKTLIVSKEAEGTAIPFGYEKISQETESNEREWFDNLYALPLGFSYESAISYTEYQKLSPLQKQTMLMEALTVEDGEENNVLESFQWEETLLPFEIAQEKGLRWDREKKKLIVQEQGGSLIIDFVGRDNSETYIELVGFHQNEETEVVSIFYQGQQTKKESEAHFPASPWYWGRKDYLVNLSYAKEAQKQVTLIFEAGEYDLEEICFYALPMDRYPEQINRLKEEILENTKLGTNQVTGDITLSKEKYVFFSIPYSKGWTAKVNGESAKILQTNTAFMSLKLPAGQYHIELNYRTPGLILGIVVSSLGMGVFIVHFFFLKRKKKEELE